MILIRSSLRGRGPLFVGFLDLAFEDSYFQIITLKPDVQR